MSGLEAVEINFSKLEVDNEKFRFDSEFFQKRFVYSYALVRNKKHVDLRDVIDILTDFHANGSYETIASNFTLLDEPDYAYMVRSTDLEAQDYTSNVKYVSKHTYDFLSKSKVYGGELLINKIGSPGRTYLMPYLSRPVSLGMNLFMVRLNNNSPICNIAVWLFLNTTLGKNIIQRKVNGTVPLTIDKAAIRSLPIPIISLPLQKALNKIVIESEQILHKSKEIYNSADILLLSSLGMTNFTSEAQPVSVKSFRESFGASGRLDAEYYQSKYDCLFEALSDLICDKLGNLVTITKSIEPGSEFYGENGIPFVRVSDINKYGIQPPEIHIPSNLTNLRPKKDTILLSKDGSVGIAYKIEQDMDCITSGALLHLRIKSGKNILPDYLTLVLNSLIVRLQAERDAGGSIIQHWKPSEIEQVVIPLLDAPNQEKIASKVQRSFELRRQSDRLLENAKRAVEIAIEIGEQAAIEWLDEISDCC